MGDSVFNYGPLSQTGYVDPLQSFASWGQPAGYNYRDTAFAGPPNLSALNGANGASGVGSWFDNMVGTKDQPGWGGLALGAASGLANAFMSMQQYGLAKKTLAENQRQFDLNYGAQRDTTNTALRDRQAARVASNPGAYQSVDDYMRTNQIK